MPILFLIIAFALFNQKICDRVSVGYNCILPPSMGPEMRDQITKLLKLAPLLLLFNAFWVLDNKALFENVWTFKIRVNEFMQSNHLLLTEFRISPSTIVLWTIIVAVMMEIMEHLIPRKTLVDFDLCTNTDIKDVDEDLPPF